MSDVPDSEAQKLMGMRLRVLRDALGLTQEEMAETMGCVSTALSAWEIGRNKIDIVMLARCADRWGFTTDWVSRGDLSTLRRDLADKIEAALKAERAAPRRGRPRSHPAPPSPPSLGGSVAKDARHKNGQRATRLPLELT